MAGDRAPDREILEAVRRWQAGIDREANFRKLVDAHYPRVRFFFAKRGFSEDDCRDLTQETFLGIYRGLAGFRSEARFETWLFQIAANTYRKTLRDRRVIKRRMEVEAQPMTDLPRELPADTANFPDPREDALRSEQRWRLRRAIAALPVQMRTCLALRIYQERSYREIAALMNISVETVKAHLYQARQRLKEELRDRHAGSERRTRRDPR